MMKNIWTIAILSIFILGFLGFVASTHSETEPIFSVRIIDFQSPVLLGEFLEFSYATRSISGVNGTAEVNFWIEKQGKMITSGSDSIFLGNLEERTRIAKIFLPSDFESGIYELNIEAGYNGHIQRAYRTIEVNVKGSLATIGFGFGKTNLIIIIALIILAVLNIFVIYHFEKKKIKRALQEEEQFIKRHKFSILTITFFLILGGLVYYLNFIGFLPGIPLYYYYSILAVLLVVTLFLGRNKKRTAK